MHVIFDEFQNVVVKNDYHVLPVFYALKDATCNKFANSTPLFEIEVSMVRKLFNFT